ncbi:MAG: tetraacyldisaccharide 4'-kinase, partial [Proteobacteria bacterium]|nr:tetraacyldisaccharide 4'-kinase [Pseudomonadota bacterium]
MPRAPAFWSHDGLLARLLSPLSVIGAALTARRVAQPGWQAPVPVICVGNATVGGAGKTTLVLDLAQRLVRGGVAVHILLRGYGGSAKGPRRVRPDDDAATVGDEALLLAAVAPTWTGADRAASGR